MRPVYAVTLPVFVEAETRELAEQYADRLLDELLEADLVQMHGARLTGGAGCATVGLVDDEPAS